LSEELALRIAAETGVDESWLLEGDLSVPPQRGKALLAFSRKQRPDAREDYEWQRAYNERPAAPESELAEVIKKGPRTKGDDLELTGPQAKAAVLARQPVMLESMDEKLLEAMKSFFKQTLRSPDALLVRWKLRRLMEGLAKERSIKLPPRDLWPPTPDGWANRPQARGRPASR
jgi:hypothetical protein